MMTLTQCVGRYWHWVERDLLSLGYRADDIGTPKLTLWELISIVIASPIGSAVREKMDGGWTPTDHMIANLAEQQAGITELTGRYPRPGVTLQEAHTRSPQGDWKPLKGVKFQSFEPEEYLRKRSEAMRRNQRWAQENPEQARERASRSVIPKQGQL